MRVFEGRVELTAKHLGLCPEFQKLQAAVTAMDLLSPDTITNENVFAGTHRLTASNPYAPLQQKHSVSERSAVLADLVQPQIQFLQRIYSGHVPVLIQCATLPPGAELLWHIDSYLYQSVSHKVHFVIKTNDDAVYECRDKFKVRRSYHFQEGHVYEINNILMHRSANRGDTPRTHVIIDMMPEQQLNEFRAAKTNFFFTYHGANKLAEMNESKEMQ
jgi:hypothetical protein